MHAMGRDGWGRLWVATLVLSGLCWVGGCNDGKTPLVLYSPHGRDLLELVERTYEGIHPKVDVRWLDMGSQEVFDRIRSERANPQADVWYGGPDTIFAQGATGGLLASYRPSWAAALPAGSQAPDDLYFGLYQAVPILIYNSDALSAEEAPQDWDDLLDPRWQDQVIIRDPLASGTMRTAFGMILARSLGDTGSVEAGFEWLRRLDAQTKEYVINPALLFEKLVRQEGLVSIWELTDLQFLKQRGSPLDYHFPSSGTPLIVDSIGVVAGAPHTEEAKAFVEWVGSREALLMTASEAFRLPARSDVVTAELPEWAQRALEELVAASIDQDLIAQHGADWMKRWDREIRNQG